MLLAYWSEASSEQGRASELWGAAQKSPWRAPPAVCRGKRGSNADLRSGYVLYSIHIVIIKGNGIFQGTGALLTQTIETDTPSFYSFGKWGLWKRHFIFWQYQTIERQSGRGNHWYHEWNKTHETHIKQVLHMVLTRNRDSELYELRNAIILFSRITTHIYYKSKFVRYYIFFYLPGIRQER